MVVWKNFNLHYAAALNKVFSHLTREHFVRKNEYWYTLVKG